MGTHNLHHYVPVFLLKKWQSSADRKLSCFHWVQGRLLVERYKAKSVAKQQGLYRLAGRRTGHENAVERDYLGPEVDSPAAEAHRAIVERGVRALDHQGKTHWSRFLVSLLLRTPGKVQEIRRRGRETLTASLEKSPEEYARIRGLDPAETALEWVNKNAPLVFDDLGVATLPALIESKPLNRAILKASWATRTLTPGSLDLLMCDSPLIYQGTMGGSFLLILPVTPRRVFFAFNQLQTWDNLRACSDAAVAKRVNRHVVDAAVQYVYGTDDGQRPFIERYLRTSG